MEDNEEIRQLIEKQIEIYSNVLINIDGDDESIRFYTIQLAYLLQQSQERKFQVS